MLQSPRDGAFRSKGKGEGEGSKGSAGIGLWGWAVERGAENGRHKHTGKRARRVSRILGGGREARHRAWRSGITQNCLAARVELTA